jgi:hypothetical protein
MDEFVMELRTELAMFLREKENKLCEEFETQGFIVSLAYLADIFSHLNDLNISLQGSEVTVLDVNEKIAVFQQKLALWKRRVATENYANFPNLENVVLSGGGVLETVPDWTQGDILSHLKNLMHSFDEYFIQDELKNDQWILNPFTFNLDSMDDADMQKDDIIDFQSKALLK